MEVAQSFAIGLQALAESSVKEADRERKQLEEERKRHQLRHTQLEEGWEQLAEERRQFEKEKARSRRRCLAERSESVPLPNISEEYIGTELDLQLNQPNASCTINGYQYAVLPPRPMDDCKPGSDMFDQMVRLPRGWEVLSSTVDGFETVMLELALKPWGCWTVCVRNGRGGFDSYRTPLSNTGGLPGTRHEVDMDWLADVDSSGMKFKFTGFSGRLVIRRAGLWPPPPELPRHALTPFGEPDITD